MRPHIGRRFVFSAVGVIFMALGITTLTLAGLGTSPVSAPIWVATLGGGLSFGGWTVVGNALLIAIQLVLLRRDFPRSGWLQIPAVLVLATVIDLWSWVLGWVPLETYFHRIVQLLIGVVFMGISVAIQMAADLLYLPGEGTVAAIAKVTKVPFPRLKVMFDVSMVTLALILSLILFGEIRGLREGTVVAAFAVGIVAGFVNPTVQRALKRLLGEKEPAANEAA
ncbi:MAG: hypothetical protein GX596_01085 [Propionibacterium sp.]|nr:hypothetical protein [Propionibacterium sp.]